MRPAASGLACALLAALLAAFPRAGRGDTVLNGEYTLQTDLRKQDRNYDWDFDSNNSDTFANSQFRVFSQPWPGVEAFVEAEAHWNPGDNNAARPYFQYRQADARYRLDRGGSGIDTYLFSRQDHFWVENHLIQVVQGGAAGNDGNSQGIRSDVWGLLGMNATFVYSDFSGQFDPSGSQLNPARTDDAVVVRLRREFLGHQLRTGFTYNRKVENEPGDLGSLDGPPNLYASVAAGDARYTWKNIDFSLEYAQSFAHYGVDLPFVTSQDSLVNSKLKGAALPPNIFDPSGLNRRLLGIPLSDRGVWVGEIRSIRLGSPTVGYLNLAPVGWTRGALFDNRLGDSNRDERGWLLNTWYLVPARALTLTNNFLRFEKRATQHQRVTEWYSEAYVEFVNGFTGKLYYRRHHSHFNEGELTESLDKQDDVFAELQVESRLAWLRIEGKIASLSTPNRKQVASIETSVNIGEHTKLYNRLMFGNDPTGLRRIVFSQLQYRPAGNMDLFLEYGPGWIGSSANPVDDGNLAGSGTQKDMIKFTLRGTF